MKVITYVFTTGRKASINNLKNNALDFYYGATLLDSENYDVHILEFKNSFSIFARTLNRLEYYLSRLVSLPINFSKIISKSNFEILKKSDHIIFVSESTALSTLPMLLLLKRYNIKTSLFVMGLFSKEINFKSLKFLHNFCIRLVIKVIDNLFFLGKGEFNLAKKIYPNEHKFSYFPFCVDTKFWDLEPKDVKDKRQILFVGNDGNRNFQLLYKITTIMPNFNFKVLTNNRDYRFEDLKNVEFINGSLSRKAMTDIELRKIYNESNLTILPLKNSFQPSGQSVALQSLASGTPVLISKTKGFWDEDLFFDKSEIFFANSDNEYDWKQLIENIIHDESLLKNITRKGKNLVIQEYSLEKFLFQLKEYL